MSSLKVLEKRKIENLFGMQSGYVISSNALTNLNRPGFPGGGRRHRNGAAAKPRGWEARCRIEDVRHRRPRSNWPERARAQRGRSTARNRRDARGKQPP